MPWEALWTTVRLAALTTVILLLLGTPLAYWLAFSRRRIKFLVEAIVALPLVLPPTVLGFYLLIAFSPASWPGRLYQEWSGDALPFTFQALVIASVLYSLPFAVQPLIAGFSSLDPRMIEASWTLGVSRPATFFRLILPHSLGSVLMSVVLTFAHTVGEFGVVLMVGGNIEGATRTLSIAIYDDVQALDYQTASRTSLLLLAFSFLVLTAVYALDRRGVRRLRGY